MAHEIAYWNPLLMIKQCPKLSPESLEFQYILYDRYDEAWATGHCVYLLLLLFYSQIIYSDPIKTQSP